MFYGSAKLILNVALTRMVPSKKDYMHLPVATDETGEVISLIPE